jgi:hypothetical protein
MGGEALYQVDGTVSWWWDGVVSGHGFSRAVRMQTTIGL